MCASTVRTSITLTAGSAAVHTLAAAVSDNDDDDDTGDMFRDGRKGTRRLSF